MAILLLSQGVPMITARSSKRPSKPACRSTIQIFTLAGDLVQTIDHDGSRGDGQAYWNLITRNGQEVASGIYIFVVQPRDPGFERATGKFVVVR